MIALLPGYTVGRVVLVRGAITERNMRIRFLRHGNKLNRGIPLHSLLKWYSTLVSQQQPVVGKMELYSRHPQQGTKEGAIARSPCVSRSIVSAISRMLVVQMDADAKDVKMSMAERENMA